MRRGTRLDNPHVDGTGCRHSWRDCSARRRWLVPALVLAALTGCESSTELSTLEAPELSRSFDDQRPDFVPANALDSVVMLFAADRNKLASATIIAPNRLLTAAHVIDDLPVDESGTFSLEVDRQARRLRLVAAGNPELPHGDWAILESGTADLSPVVTIHPAALAPDWEPAPGSDLLLAGYARGFYLMTALIDPAEPTPCIAARFVDRESGIEGWLADGDALNLGGMSGGGAMIWNAASGRAELFGIVRGCIGTVETTKIESQFLGLTVWTHHEHTAGISHTINRLPLAAMK